MILKATGSKGFLAEEALRCYFRSIGYFAIRGIPLVYKKIEVSDVDLWLYVKTTSLTSERSCVDVKSKRSPQALERVVWAKGVKEILRIDRALVVTTDNRPEIRDFGTENGVDVLQGDFLARTVASFPPKDNISEEELFFLIDTPCIINSKVNWRIWYRAHKTRLLDSLNFNGCNTFLLAVKFLFEEYIATGKKSEVSIRLLYIIIAYFLVTLDYKSRSFVQLGVIARNEILVEGFRYGEAGHQRTEEVFQMALQLLIAAGKNDLFSRADLQNEFQMQASEYKAEILGEHFAKSESLKNLFLIACSFEELAYSKKLSLPDEIPSELKAIIGLISDFLGIDRKTII
jgi:hypothetical protein